MQLPMPVQKKEVSILRPESVVKRELPLNFQQGDLSLFAHELEKVIPKTRLLELQNVWVSSDGFLFRGLEILPESFAFPFLRDNWKRRSVVKLFVTNYFLRKRRKVAKALWIVDDWSGGYFHWIADALTRLYTIKDRLDDLVLLLPGNYERLEFVRSSLKAFNIRTEFVGPAEVVFSEKLIVPTHTAPSGHYNEETIRGLRDFLLNFYGRPLAGPAGDRIYISRSAAPRRKIANEEEVVAVLREFDFKVIRSEDYSFEQQVRIASNARWMVSNHGAGLTNMLFMTEGSIVLELRHSTDRINNCYFTLASSLNHRYFYQTCEPQTPGEDAHTADLIVDVRRLRENIDLMLRYDE